jgi:hypothetical protein
LKSITLTQQVWFDETRSFARNLIEGERTVSWLSEVPQGIQVRFDSGTSYLIPWGNISVAQYE